MPRRRAAEANAVAGEIERARWRYAIRHPAFFKELRAVTVHYTIGAEEQSPEWQDAWLRFMLRWGFNYIYVTGSGNCLATFRMMDAVAGCPSLALLALEYLDANPFLFAVPLGEIEEQRGSPVRHGGETHPSPAP
jgi:hypothetical protein